MPNTAQTNRRWFLAALEGVGTYGVGVGSSLAIAAAVRGQGATFKNVPNFVNRLDPAPTRHGGGAVRSGATNDYTWNQFALEYIVPGTDDSTRPDQNIWLQTHGFTQDYDDGGGGGPFTRTYTLQDQKDLCNSAVFSVPMLMSDAVNMKRETWNGARGTGIVTFTPGNSIMYAGAGKMIGYTGPTDVTPILISPTFSRSPEIIWASSVSATISIVGGSTYSGPISAVEMRGLQHVGETPGGGLDGVDEVTTVAEGPYELDFQVDDQSVAAVNMKTAMDAESIVQIVIDQPTATAGTEIDFVFQCQIIAIDPVDVNGVQMQACKAIGVCRTRARQRPPRWLRSPSSTRPRHRINGT